MNHAQPLESRLLLSAVAPALLSAASEADPGTPAPSVAVAAPAADPRLAWWRDAHFGMFIHWGLYSHLAGHWNGQTTPGLGEWIEHDLNIPPDQHAQVASQFNPTQFNAQQWVQIAKSAGMKYIVITSKHPPPARSLWAATPPLDWCDGFSLGIFVYGDQDACYNLSVHIQRLTGS